MLPLTNKKILFLIGFISYCIFLWVKNNGVVFHPLIQGYFSDVFALPIMLSIVLIVLRWYANDPNYKLSGYKIIFALVYISIAFEWIIPMYKSNFHADWWDVVAYGAGALIYWICQNSNKLNSLLDKKKPYPINE